MTWAGVWYLARRDLWATRSRSAISAAGIGLGVWVLALGLGARDVVMKRELAILRAVGATRAHLLSLVLLQAAALGLAGGCGGLAVARGMAMGVDAMSKHLVPDLPFKPESFFVCPPWLWAAALTAALASAVLGALSPAWRAVHSSIPRALAG